MPKAYRPASIPVPVPDTPSAPQPASSSWFSFAIPTDSTLVTAVAKGSFDTLYTCPAGAVRHRLNGLTVTNISAPGSYVQVYIGIIRADAASSTDWQPIVSPYLNGGDPAFTWFGEMYLGDGDRLVAYADVASRGSVSFGIDEVR